MSTKTNEKAEDIDYFKYLNERDPSSIMTVPIYSKNSEKFDLYPPNLLSKVINFYQMNFCKLPDEKLFCFINTPGIFPIKYTCFIIDKFNNIEAIQKGSPSCYAGSIYHNGCIYVIGCFSSIGINNKFEKYNIKRKMWFRLPDIKTTANRHSCDVLGNKIIYSGDTIDIYIYDIFLNSHCVALEFNENNYKDGDKYIFCAKSRAYAAIYNGEIYESCEDDLCSWSIFMKNSWLYDKCLISYPIVYGNYFALLFSNKTIYKLNLSTKKVITIKLKQIIN